MLVTMGSRVSERCQELFAENRYHDYLKLHGLGVEMAESLAELWHKRIREELGFVDEDGPTLTGLLSPAVSRRSVFVGLSGLSRPHGQREGRRSAGSHAHRCRVSEGFQLHPEQTTDAIICHHPMAKYFVA